MAGKEKRGVEEADADLFRGRTYVLTPRQLSEIDFDFLEWVRRIGANPVILDPGLHDRVVAFTSHLPQLLSTALAVTLAGNQDDHLDVAGPGLVDMTRLAQSPYEVWRDILATNAAEIERALSACIGELEQVRDNLRSRGMEEAFGRAGELASRLRETGAGERG